MTDHVKIARQILPVKPPHQCEEVADGRDTWWSEYRTSPKKHRRMTNTAAGGE